MNKFLILTAFVLLATGCGGSYRSANPVSTVQTGDSYMSCYGIEAEMASVQQQARALSEAQSSTDGANVALGAGALVVWPLLFAMDLSETDQMEANALHKRYNHLQKLYDSRCY